MNHANLWATIVFQIGDPKTENYAFHGLGIEPAGSKKCAKCDLAWNLLAFGLSTQRFFEILWDSWWLSFETRLVFPCDRSNKNSRWFHCHRSPQGRAFHEDRRPFWSSAQPPIGKGDERPPFRCHPCWTWLLRQPPWRCSRWQAVVRLGEARTGQTSGHRPWIRRSTPVFRSEDSALCGRWPSGYRRRIGDNCPLQESEEQPAKIPHLPCRRRCQSGRLRKTKVKSNPLRKRGIFSAKIAGKGSWHYPLFLEILPEAFQIRRRGGLKIILPFFY